MAKRSFLSIILLLVLILTLAPACIDDDDEKEATEATQSEAASPTEMKDATTAPSNISASTPTDTSDIYFVCDVYWDQPEVGEEIAVVSRFLRVLDHGDERIFAALSNGADECPYLILSISGTQWESWTKEEQSLLQTGDSRRVVARGILRENSNTKCYDLEVNAPLVLWPETSPSPEWSPSP